MNKIIPIINLAAKFASVNRTIGYREGHLENDAEHSYQLALVCWSVNVQYNLKLKDELILKYALVHDLVEVYAGDTDAYDDKIKIASKKEREAKALESLKTQYDKFDEITGIIEKYEKKEDEESQLVYIMDKLIPDVNVYYSKSDYYQSRKININEWRKWLFTKIDYKFLSPKLKSIVDESINEIETNFVNNFYNENHS